MSCPAVKIDKQICQADNTPWGYIEEKIFPLLLPALQQTVSTASAWNVLQVQKSRFNGLDYLSEILWNKNPRRSKKHSAWLHVFDIPPFKKWLQECPRPIYPDSWLWTEDEAAIKLQRYVRGWLVRKREDVQEMRQFWKIIAGKKYTDEEYYRQPAVTTFRLNSVSEQ